jgi:hypothetical protein
LKVRQEIRKVEAARDQAIVSGTVPRWEVLAKAAADLERLGRELRAREHAVALLRPLANRPPAEAEQQARRDLERQVVAELRAQLTAELAGLCEREQAALDRIARLAAALPT